MNGTDVYFRFIAGFGNFNHLADGHFSATDNTMVNAPISSQDSTVIVYGHWMLYRTSGGGGPAWFWHGMHLAFRDWYFSMVKTRLHEAFFITSDRKCNEWDWYEWPSGPVHQNIESVVLQLQKMRSCGGGRSPSYVLLCVVRLTIEINTLTSDSLSRLISSFVSFPLKLPWQLFLLLCVRNRIL